MKSTECNGLLAAFVAVTHKVGAMCPTNDAAPAGDLDGFRLLCMTTMRCRSVHSISAQLPNCSLSLHLK
jgi:hypothetical protein